MKAGVLKNITWLGLGSAVVKPIWLFFITAVCMRLLNAQEYGIMTAALALMSIAGSFTGLGTTRYSIREVARNYNRTNRFFANFFLLRIGLSVVVFGLALSVGWLLNYKGQAFNALAFAGIYMMALELTNYCRAYYRAYERMELEAASTIIEKILVVGLGWSLLYVYRSVPAVVGGMMVGMVLTLLLNFAWLSRHLITFQPTLFSLQFLRSKFRTALPLGLSSLFVVLYMKTDAVMVEAMIGEEAAGQYGAAFRLLQTLVLLPTIVQTAFFPRLANLFNATNQQAFKDLLKQGIGGLTLLSVPIAVGLMFFSHDIIAFIAPDPAFRPAANALQILGWTFPFMCINTILNTTLVASNDQHMAAGFLGGAVVFNILLNFTLIPLYSFYGACVATLLTEAGITAAMSIRYWLHTHPSIAALR